MNAYKFQANNGIIFYGFGDTVDRARPSSVAECVEGARVDRPKNLDELQKMIALIENETTQTRHIMQNVTELKISVGCIGDLNAVLEDYINGLGILWCQYQRKIDAINELLSGE